jgi:uncharacterized protein (TIGR02680 family)
VNFNAQQSRSLASEPPLPTPGRIRWQPLRLGLVDLFHYDSEEFWFRDGHLLLRGNNGTGKSKVLSLTLPFLFDAQLKPSRVEPDGDSTKKMSWNLLLGRHDRRMGYAWIEFGRLGEDGEPQYLTLGSGLSAVASRPQVDCWFFLLEGRRIGCDLWLTNPQRVVLTKERLREALGDHGQVFETAIAYRRAVDERLFQLGTARYAALMDTLIQLRQPQLSKKPDEVGLSNALTEALPPLSTDLLGDVAEALNQLEEDRRQLVEYEALLRAVGAFDDRYRHYAMTQTRRQARVLRSAQTGFDNASRAFNEAKAELGKAREGEAQADDDLRKAKSALASSRTRQDVLRSDPLNREASRLEAAAKDASEKEGDAGEAERAAREAARKRERESEAAAERRRVRAQKEQDLSDVRSAALEAVQSSGLFDAWSANPLCSAAAGDVANLDTTGLDGANAALRDVLDRRRRHASALRRRRNEVDRAEREHVARAQTCVERAEEAEAAAQRRTAADRMVEQEGRALLDAWQGYFDGLQQLAVTDMDVVLEDLAAWIVTIQGESPARLALQSAMQHASERLAKDHVHLSADRRALEAEKLELEEERQRLLLGDGGRPAVSPFRAEGTRIDRAGAPLWQLVDFHEEVGSDARAGLEAALEASDLLDAWVTPDGRLHAAADGKPLLDTQLLQRPHRAATLVDWLRPSGTSVAGDIVSDVLRGIACTTDDDGADETWISPDGRFRIGPLAGAWSKPVAVYIGYAARAAARQRRLGAIASRLGELAAALADLENRFAEHARQADRASVEWRGAPVDDALRGAHAEASSCSRAFQAASVRLEEAERQLDEAAQALQVARRLLTQDASDLHLPETHAGLDLVESALTRLAEAALALAHGADSLRQAEFEYRLQREREKEAENVDDQAAEQATERRARAEEARTRLDTIRESVGDKVADFQQRLEEAAKAVADGERLYDQRNDAARKAAEERAGAGQKVSDAETTLQERADTREQAIARLKGFAATDLLPMALPDIEVPDQRATWTIEPALNLARRAEQALSDVADDDEAWRRIQSQLSQDYTVLSTALTALSHQAQMEQTADFGLVVTIVYQNRPERPDRLKATLEAEIGQRRELLTAREREVLESHLEAEIAAAIQRLLQDADRQVDAINKELHKRPTSTGVRFRLQWQPLAEGADGAPVGLEEARKRLLNTNADLWSPEDRRVVGVMLQQRIEEERASAEDASAGSLLDQLAKALDYRRWHRFSIQRWQDGQWRKLSGPASSGERALGLTVPLFAAVASFYSQSGYPRSPRLVLLDEVFAGIDDAARAHCMGLIREFDLDFMVTSEREWGCYAELPGVSICQLQRHEGIDAIHVSRWTWDGRAKHREQDPNRRFSDA